MHASYLKCYLNLVNIGNAYNAEAKDHPSAVTKRAQFRIFMIPLNHIFVWTKILMR